MKGIAAEAACPFEGALDCTNSHMSIVDHMVTQRPHAITAGKLIISCPTPDLNPQPFLFFINVLSSIRFSAICENYRVLERKKDLRRTAFAKLAI